MRHLDLMNDEDWNYLIESQSSIPENWNERCKASIQAEKKEVEKRYNIKIGQTEIYCQRCNKPCWPNKHLCEDLRLEKLNEANRAKAELRAQEREDERAYMEELLERIKELGAEKASVLSWNEEEGTSIPKKVISNWIYRGSIPNKYIPQVERLLKCVSEQGRMEFEEIAP